MVVAVECRVCSGLCWSSVVISHGLRTSGFRSGSGWMLITGLRKYIPNKGYHGQVTLEEDVPLSRRASTIASPTRQSFAVHSHLTSSISVSFRLGSCFLSRLNPRTRCLASQYLSTDAFSFHAASASIQWVERAGCLNPYRIITPTHIIAPKLFPIFYLFSSPLCVSMRHKSSPFLSNICSSTSNPASR